MALHQYLNRRLYRYFSGAFDQNSKTVCYKTCFNLRFAMMNRYMYSIVAAVQRPQRA